MQDKDRMQLLDPQTLGEDLKGNARRAIGYASRHCGDCHDFHVAYPVYRAFGRLGATASDRRELIDLLESLIARRLHDTDAPVDVVVAGAADTQVPAMCAHAARTQATGAARIRLMIVDRCDTPLRLCRDFARQNDLALQTRLIDLLQPGPELKADIVVVHSLFKWLPADSHDRVLRRLADWLKPGGLLLFQAVIHPPSSDRDFSLRAAQARDLVRAAIDAGDLSIPEPRERFEQRLLALRRPLAEFETLAQLHALFERCGLAVIAGGAAAGQVALPAAGAFGRTVFQAALARSAEPLKA